MQPLRLRAFVVMPFGEKGIPREPKVEATEPPLPRETVLRIDFDAVYHRLLAPALIAAGVQPFRGDQEKGAGDILKDMFADLVTADLVVADISILNANVFYELGIRHAAVPRRTICLHAGWSRRPFDVGPLWTFDYPGKLFEVGHAVDAQWLAEVAAATNRLADTLRGAIEADRITESSPVYAHLPKLQPVDATKVETARFKHYGQQAQQWEDRIIAAEREGRAADILTFAEDVPSPFHRRRLLERCGSSLVALGRFSAAERVYQLLLREIETIGAPGAIRVQSNLALVLNRLKRGTEAERILQRLASEAPDDADVKAFLGRVYKDIWRTRWMQEPVATRFKAAARHNAVGMKALRTYDDAYRRRLDNYFAGINAVSLAALLDHVMSKTSPATPAALLDRPNIMASVQVAAQVALDRSRGESIRASDEIWAAATLGELALVHGNAEEAQRLYESATAHPDLTYFQVRSMLEQLKLFELLDYEPQITSSLVALLESRLAALPNPITSYRKVAVCSGHMIDKRDASPRFPEAKAKDLGDQIARIISHWDLGPNDLAICGGACGADILFGEACADRGVQLQILLSEEQTTFVANSVRFAGSKWVARFYALCNQAKVATQPERLGSPPPNIDRYSRNNLWIVNTGSVEAPSSADLYALMVWDEKPTGHGPGGTSDFASRVRELAAHIEIINPTQIQ